MTTNLRDKTISNILGNALADPIAPVPAFGKNKQPSFFGFFGTSPTQKASSAFSLPAMPSMPKVPSLPSFGSSSFGSSSFGPSSSFFSGLPSFRPSSSFFSGQPVPAAATSGASFFLNVLFYLFMYAFLIFLVLVFIHFTVRPIFIFTPGGPGYISMAANNDNIVYWNSKKQPANSSIVPVGGDSLDGNDFTNNFSFSLDLYVRKIKDTNPFTRLILYKGNKSAVPLTPPPFTPTDQNPQFTMDDFTSYMQTSQSSMIMYMTDTNDLVITFFSDGASYSCPPIKNVPLYTPFRISVITESSLFTVYLNNKLLFQRVLPSKIKSPVNQVFYSSPSWANLPNQTIFIQNFNLWNRVIPYAELLGAQPALALTSDFGLPKDTTSS